MAQNDRPAFLTSHLPNNTEQGLQLSAELLICAYKGNVAASSGEAEEERADLERLGKTRKDGFFSAKGATKQFIVAKVVVWGGSCNVISSHQTAFAFHF